MKLLMGLGNPGSEYEKNRHNVGFLFVDFLYAKSTVLKPWSFDKYFKAEIAEIDATAYKCPHLLLAKPQTFMNKSGESLKSIVIRYSLTPDDVCIIHDDLDILFGEFKINKGKGPKQHNGLKSIEDHWKTNEFWRIRLGVDGRKGIPISGSDYVLQNFSPEEYLSLNSLFDQVITHPSFPFSMAESETI